MNEKADGLLHLWSEANSFKLTHATTGYRIICTRLRPGPANPDNWEAIVVDNGVNVDQTQREAHAAGMELDAYVDYLAETAIELAATAERKNRGARNTKRIG